MEFTFEAVNSAVAELYREEVRIRSDSGTLRNDHARSPVEDLE